MCDLRGLRMFVTWFVTGVAVVCCFVSLGLAGPAEETFPQESVYHADREHLWNRLHRAIFVRVGPDGRTYGRDRLEPLLWYESKHLLEERSHERAIALLEEFLKNSGEKLIEDPLKRAVLQRDLWLVFNWIEFSRRSFGFAEPRLSREAARAARERLRRPLAAVIGRLALRREQIEKLPDNYAAAVASSEFATSFDREKPDRAYLPADLFAPDGRWVCVGRRDGRTAPEHLRDDNNPFSNSVFLVFLSLPGGRAATVEYLERLRAFDEPLLVPNPDASRSRWRPFVPNGKLPQFPDGTELALVRRAMLIDSTHAVVASPLTESVQLRTMYPEVPAAAGMRGNSLQFFQEFRLSRLELFADRGGGLRAVGPNERDLKTGFRAHAFDPFETRPPYGTAETLLRTQQFTIKSQCLACHSRAGVSSFNSFQDFTGLPRNVDRLRPFPLRATTISAVAQAAVQWKEGRTHWTSLRKILLK